MPDLVLYGRAPRAFMEPKTQVFNATHIQNDAGEWQRSPLMYRSFISFTFGGKHIEDFNLIAITKDDRINKAAYSNINNINTNYDILDGQYYWGTTMAARQIDFTLATDGITEEELNAFLYWFQPGVTRELILAEHPNRAIMARIAAAPQLSVLPFEKKTSFKFNNIKYPTSVTLYKGEISFSFESDEPYWYAKHNYIYQYFTDKENKFETMRSSIYSQDEPLEEYYRTLEDKDFVKVIIEDHIPHLDMVLVNDILLGNNKRVNLSYSIVGPADNVEEDAEGMSSNSDEIPSINSVPIALIDKQDGDPIEGVVGTIIDNEGITLGEGQTKYLFYSGTAPENPIIQFTLNPVIINPQDDKAQDGNGAEHHFIIYPLNTYTPEDWFVNQPDKELPEKPYNVFRIGNQEMRFSLPSVYLGFNEAKYIVKTLSASGNNTVDKVREALRDGVHDTYAREWALACLVGWTETVNFNDFSTRMNYFIMSGQHPDTAFTSATFTFDSGKGTCIGKISVRRPLDTIQFNSTPNSYPIAGTSITEIVEENTGDMMQSPYLIINERRDFNEDGYVTNTNCLEITTDYPSSNPLTNVTIKYRNMYY